MLLLLLYEQPNLSTSKTLFLVKSERRRKASIMDWLSVKLKIELNRDDQSEDDEE